ncbi:MAG: hypothetical protein JW794_09480 [Candidatus Cloacimonetes bacterium]|nr:hypothetical protein [Candidatus Cloacimonadota bacterium]
MKYKNTIILCIIICIIIALGAIAIVRFSPRVFSTDPRLNDGKQWRIGYYEGGPFIDYSLSIRGTVKGLIQLGWITPINIPAFLDDDDTELIWNHIAQNVNSKFITFVKDAFWSSAWNDSLRIKNRKDALDKLKNGYVDIMIAAGTWAGQDLVNSEHSVPTMVITSSDPIQAGIIKCADDSGYDHIFVECDPYRYQKQVELFHDIIGFERLGVMFEDSEDGRIYANFSDLEKVSKQRDFKLIICHANEEDTEQGSFENAMKSYQILAPIVDAMWIGLHQGESTKFLPQLLEPIFEFHVPTWCVLGEPAVKKGVLLSITHQNYDDLGLWYASNIAKILNGAKPRELSQIYEENNHIMINAETARRIKYKIPQTLYDIADKVYNTIE